MGDITDSVLDGTLCEDCGGIVYEGDPNKATKEDLSPGFPRKCKECKEEENDE